MPTSHVITAKHKDELIKIVEANPRVPCGPQLLNMINKASDHNATLEQLRNSMITVLSAAEMNYRRFYLFGDPRPQHTRLSQDLAAFFTAQIQEFIRLDSIEFEHQRSVRLSSSRKTSIETGYEKIIPLTEAQFIRKMIINHEMYVEELCDSSQFNITLDGAESKLPLLNKTVVWLIDEFVGLRYKFDNAPDPLSKCYYCMRLLSLQKWATQDGYVKFIASVKRILDLAEANELNHIPTDNLDIIKWSTSFYSKHRVGETPFAIALINEIILDSKNLYKDDKKDTHAKMKEYIRAVNSFVLFFMLEDSVEKLNLDYVVCAELTKQLDNLIVYHKSGDIPHFTTVVFQVEKTMEKILIELKKLKGQIDIEKKLKYQFLMNNDKKESIKSALTIDQEIHFKDLAKYQSYYEQEDGATELKEGRRLILLSLKSRKFNPRSLSEDNHERNLREFEPWQIGDNFLFFTADDKTKDYSDGTASSSSRRGLSSLLSFTSTPSSSQRTPSSRQSSTRTPSTPSTSGRSTNESSSTRSNANQIEVISPQKKNIKIDRQ